MSTFVGYGHTSCRQHAACKEVKPDGCVVWNPDLCPVCDAIKDEIYDQPLPAPPVRKIMMSHFRKWANGFRKNRTGRPFLCSERWRLALFRKSSKSFVWSESTTTFRKMPLVTIDVDSASSEVDPTQDGEISMEVENELLQYSDIDIGDEGDDSLSEISTPYESDTGCSDGEEGSVYFQNDKQEQAPKDTEAGEVVSDPVTGAISKTHKTVNPSPDFAPVSPTTHHDQGPAPTPGRSDIIPPVNNTTPALNPNIDLLTAITQMNQNMAMMSAQMQQSIEQNRVETERIVAQSRQDILNAQEEAKQQVAAAQAKAKKDLLVEQAKAKRDLLIEQKRAAEAQAQAQSKLAKAQAEATKQAEIERSILLQKQKTIEEELARIKNNPAVPTYHLPPSDQLPPCEANNPWIEGPRVCVTEDGYYSLPNAGIKHGDDLVFFPHKDEFPKVWVRLSKDLVDKDDLIINETLLYPHDAAQASYRRLIRKADAVSSQVGINGKKTSTYSAPKNMVFPFTEKVFLAAKAAWRDEKGKFPALKEFDAVSLLCPNSTDDWKDCALTFKPGRLNNDAARVQIKENVHLIPIKYLKEEFDARIALAQALATQTMSEFGVHTNLAALKAMKPIPGAEKTEEALKTAAEIARLIAKQHTHQFALALFRFGEARRACRRAAFISAKVRHEPERLINSSIWGEFLFPEALIQEVRENAANADKSLLAKWGMPQFDSKKRAAQGNMGPPPKRGKFNPKYSRLPDESPAYNNRYENRNSSYRQDRGKSFRNRKNKGRGAKNYHGGRGGQGGFRGNYRGQDNFRGSRGGRVGRGGHQSTGKQQGRPDAPNNTPNKNQSQSGQHQK